LKTKKFSVKKEQKIPLSVVVCCKNEQEKLPLLLLSIEAQISENEQFIFVNDNSTDNTFSILNDFKIACKARNYNNVQIVQNPLFGKKNALKIAVKSANSDYVVCIDADCILPKNYFSIVSSFLSENQPDLMIGGVTFLAGTKNFSPLRYTNNVFQKIQALEFASLQASGAGATLAGMPIMCNGANLAFHREIWQKAENQLVERELSGDDVFLLHYVKKIGGKILYLKSEESFVTTFSVGNFGEFLRQRQRWASKARSYTDWQTIFTAFIVFFLNFEIIFAFFASFFIPFFKTVFFIIFISKLLIDSILLIPFLNFSKQKRLAKFIPILSLLYPFYIVFTAILGLFGKVKWKN
jgi:cellulose synthase/poly-beta-1,6-N-acetylglucosamine synthase-like glycosyltransferase